MSAQQDGVASDQGTGPLVSLEVVVRVLPERRQQFLDAITTNARACVRDEPGCLRFHVSQSEADEDVYGFYELYADRAALEAHRATPHFARWRAAAAECLVPGSLHVTEGSVLLTLAADDSTVSTTPDQETTS